MLDALIVLAVAALGVGQSAAQTGTPSPGGIPATSPLGTIFSTPSVSSPTTVIPYSGTAKPAPCSSGNPGTAALPTFDGGGVSLSTNSPTSGLSGAVGATASTSVPCNSDSSSGVMSSSNNSGSGATSSSSSSSSGISATATANSALDVSGLGASGLGTNGLGTTGLGTTALGSVTGSISQTSTSLKAANAPQTSCPELPGTTVTTETAGTVPDPAQTLAGGGSLPETQCPNPAPSTGASDSSMMSE